MSLKRPLHLFLIFLVINSQIWSFGWFSFFANCRFWTFRISQIFILYRFCHAAFFLQRILWGWVLRVVWAWRQEERIQQETKPNHVIRNHIIKWSYQSQTILNRFQYKTPQNANLKVLNHGERNRLMRRPVVLIVPRSVCVSAKVCELGREYHFKCLSSVGYKGTLC